MPSRKRLAYVFVDSTTGSNALPVLPTQILIFSSAPNAKVTHDIRSRRGVLLLVCCINLPELIATAKKLVIALQSIF